ncbi:enoyl-CoA hydratase/isomerase family protein [Hoyosella sp. G463]|uniref:Enoyl-CoA hydratase/isomerase family protein n=1 Tax=Lolliginicoccus lacisalsi TaxID=2742202 RepID=A0A927JEQ3_9ACTN|nr:enoyl-CoA hydratase/isomerase family protein [Lolliginicoccus lacisalsi]MBD8507805.1 enoyl-CoA hydratase/isomerase family protein [Lolliginicoccus lacisalsi]
MSDHSPGRSVRLAIEHTAHGAPVAVLCLDNPPLNLFEQKVFDDLAAHIAQLAASPPRAVLIHAEGKVVSGGVDVHLFEGLSTQEAEDLWTRSFAGLSAPLEAMPCPVVFCAHGLTLTAAFEIALACDLIVAGPRARFGLVEKVVGLTPSMGGPQRIAERAGSGRARELVMTGDLYDATTLADWGVVNIVDEEPLQRARDLAHQLADGPTRAHAATKQIIAAWREQGIEHADAVTPRVSGELFASSDLRSAVRSFLADGPGKASFLGE